MLATRSHHFADLTHLPDASWAVFFLAGFYLNASWIFPGLLLLGWSIDFLSIGQGVNDFCMSPAYGLLLLAYGVLWLAGRWYARRYRFHPATLFTLAATVLTGAMLAELLSSGSFYFLSGRFAEMNLASFGARLRDYFPHSLQGMALYVGAAAIVHGVLGLVSLTGVRGISNAH
jgi:hypothetical protein